MKHSTNMKRLILFLIIATSISPALFIQLDEATTTLNVYKLLAKTGSLVGTSLFAWQFIIGFRQALAYLVTDYIWSVELHKKLGIFASILILLHPAFITLFYLEKEGMNPLTLVPADLFDAYVMLGQISLVIIAVIFFTSALLRRFVPDDSWYEIHLSSYVLLPLVFIHSFPIGTTLMNTSAGYVWVGLAGILALFYIYRVLCRLTVFSARYTVSNTRKAAPDTTEINMRPKSRPVIPKLSQFIYLRRGFFESARPYTLSDYNAHTHEIAITAKAAGKTSTALQSIAPGTDVYADGPYGVFAPDIFNYDRPVVMIAGGIGITPFRRVYKKLHQTPEHAFYLFYGNQDESEIAYREEIEQTPHLEAIHVISGQADFPGEKGLITPSLIRKYVHKDLAAHMFFICGPPAMTMNLEDQLRQEGVPSEQIRHELFNY